MRAAATIGRRPFSFVRSRSRLLTPALVLLAYAVALIQRPGMAVADTKVDLFTGPARFLAGVLSIWSPTVDFGHLFGAQYSGYLWPMAPWFTAGDALGLPLWVVHRLWLGTILACAAVGVIRLLRALAPPAQSPLLSCAAALYIINPYVTVYIDRTSITLLTYAALPWLLLCVHRGLREPRRLRWPALTALIIASTGGGVNVAVTAWVLLGPLLFVLYERFTGQVCWRDILRWGWRTSLAVTLAQLWWLIPVAVQGLAAPNFLPFTEQPGTIWATTSLPESIRQMGFWTSYVGVGYGGLLRPFQASQVSLLHLLPVVLAGLMLYGGILASFVLARRWHYAPFFLLMALTGLLIMTVGWPEGTPLRRLVTGVYYRVESVQFLRTTYKGGALLALALAVLGGSVFAALWQRSTAARRRGALALGVCGLAALAAWPLVSGRAVDPQLRFDLPPTWRALANDLDQNRTQTRVLHLPGALFGYYSWGGTVDPILPALTRRSVSTRWIVPYSDLRATNLQLTVDSLIGQDRLRRGQLKPLLDLMSVGTVTLASDGDRSRSGEPPAGQLSATLARSGDPGLHAPQRVYGPLRAAATAADSSDRRPQLPTLIRWERAVKTPPLLRIIDRRRPETVVDGGAGGIVALAAFAALDSGAPLRYAPDIGAAAIARIAAGGGKIVISDTQRRAAFVAARTVGNSGPTLPATQAPSVDGAMLDPWLGDPDSQTVRTLKGIAEIDAPASPQVTQFPERRPFAAIDGDRETAWLGDRALVPARSRIKLTFTQPRDVAFIDLLPYSDSRGIVREVTVEGRRFAVKSGWNRLRLGLRSVRSLAVALTAVERPQHASAGRGGIRELRIDGLKAVERLRPPVIAERALAGGAFERGRANGATLTYLLERVTADRPSRTSRYVGERGAGLLRDRQDSERQLQRVISPPLTAPLPISIDAFGGVDPRTEDDVLDRLLGLPGADWKIRSSSRYEGLPRFRGAGAFDSSPRRGWVGQWIAGRPAWLGWQAPQPVTVSRLRIMPLKGFTARQPTRVALVVDGRRSPTIDVAADGRIALPVPLRGRNFRLEVIAARFPAGTAARLRMRRAVAIGRLHGAGVPLRSLPSRGRLQLACGAARVAVAGSVVALAGTLDRARFEAGEEVRLRACGHTTLKPGELVVKGLAAPLRVNALRLTTERSESVRPRNSGDGSRQSIRGEVKRDGSVSNAKVVGNGKGWLVLGQSFDRLWRARCDRRDLGASSPIQGYANGWRLDGPCDRLTVTYGPQQLVRAGYAISLVSCMLLLIIAVVGFRRSSGLSDRQRAWPPQVVACAPRRRTVGAAALTAALAAALIAAIFGLRAGALALPTLTLLLWRGISDRMLSLLATVLLVIAVPSVYIIIAIVATDSGSGGNDTRFANDRIIAHWLAVVAIIALAWLMLRSLRAVRHTNTAKDRAVNQQESEL